MNRNKEKQSEIATGVFNKKQIMQSDKYNKYKDILSVVLKENESYSTQEVEKKIKEFLERKV